MLYGLCRTYFLNLFLQIAYNGRFERIVAGIGSNLLVTVQIIDIVSSIDSFYHNRYKNKRFFYKKIKVTRKICVSPKASTVKKNHWEWAYSGDTNYFTNILFTDNPM